MPLLAYVDGESIISVLLDKPAWDELVRETRAKRRKVLLPCGFPGHTRVSTRGTPHFAHNPGGDGCSAGESAEHLQTKAVIVRAAIDSGWDARPEMRGDGWIADVLATGPGGTQVVFEVQWTRQDLAEYEQRTARYRDAGIGSVAWFARHVEGLRQPSRELPIFRLWVDPEPTTNVGGRTMKVAEAVTRLLSGHVRFRDHLTGTATAEIRVARLGCYRCKKPMGVWSVDAFRVVGSCGSERRVEPPQAFYPSMRIEEHPSVRAAAAAKVPALSVRCADLDSRFTATSGVTYRAFVCPFCRAVAGEFYVQAALDQSRSTTTGDLTGIPVPHSHWCINDSGFCADPTVALARWIEEAADPKRAAPGSSGTRVARMGHPNRTSPAIRSPL